MKLRGSNGTSSAIQTDTGTDVVSINESTGAITTASQLNSTVATGTAPLIVASTTLVTNLNADKVDGYNATTTPTAGTIPVADSYGRLDSWVSNSIYYGVSWNESTDAYTRTGSLAGVAVGVKAPDGLLPVHIKMRRCVINDAGAVQYYLNPNNSTLKEDGTASDLSGTAGQVMVEIPKFWYRWSYSGTTHTWEIAATALSGFAEHPAFKNGVTVRDFIYIGAYEAQLYDITTSSYIDYVSGATIDWTADRLGSVTGKRPVTNGKRSEFRAAAARRGTNWTLETYDMHSAVQLLYLIEYASFNSQSMIGAGITNVTDWASISFYPFAPSGLSNSIGNATGNTAGGTTYAGEATKYMSYRGIENFFGHIWKFIDGINVNNQIVYVSNTPTTFADDTGTNYTNIGTATATSSYQSALVQQSDGFVPSAASGTSTTKITDFWWYSSTGWRVALVGASAANGASAGFFALNCDNGAATSYAHIGARLGFQK